MQLDCVLVPLVERQDKFQECIALLNQEWPRSSGAREHSQRRSLRTSPPMSLVMVEQLTGNLIGHARICHLPNRPTACWLESVIVTRNQRGRGLGKILMNGAEEHARRFGFDTAYLSTEDQVLFYRSCGYGECAPVVHSTAATSVFPVFKSMEVAPPPVVTSTRSPSSVTSSDDSSTSSEGKGAPPPPPPPPPAAKGHEIATNTDISTIHHQYMCKSLIQ